MKLATSLLCKIAFFQRDSSTGALSGASTANALDGTAVVSGVIAGFAATTSKLFVAIAGASSSGGLVVLDVDCVLQTPAPTPAPTAAPSPAPTEGVVIWVKVCPKFNGLPTLSETSSDAWPVAFC